MGGRDRAEGRGRGRGRGEGGLWHAPPLKPMYQKLSPCCPAATTAAPTDTGAGQGEGRVRAVQG